MFAMAMQGSMPGATAADMRFMFEVLDNDKKGKPPRGGYFQREAQARRAALQEYLDNLPDPYASYLTASDLCAQSDLTQDNLSQLAVARLLLPDHDEKYRPKLAGWARKLSYLLGEGWTIDELRTWSRGRWMTTNPRQFPPNRADWRSGND
jgi:hypothetical protein